MAEHYIFCRHLCLPTRTFYSHEKRSHDSRVVIRYDVYDILLFYFTVRISRRMCEFRGEYAIYVFESVSKKRHQNIWNRICDCIRELFSRKIYYVRTYTVWVWVRLYLLGIRCTFVIYFYHRCNPVCKYIMYNIIVL